jgi:PDZ domain-containing protein
VSEPTRPVDLPPPPGGQWAQGEPSQDDRPWFAWRKLSFLAPFVVLAVVLSLVRLPYFVIQPGVAQDVEPLIHVQQHQVYPSDGHLLLTAVQLYQPNVYQALWAWIDKTRSVVPEGDILAPGESQEQEFQRARSQMDTSKIDAAVVALSKYTGYPDRHGQGVLVESVLPGSPADGKLFAGDLIMELDGRPVRDEDDLGLHIRAAGVGNPITFKIMAAGETHQVEVTPVRDPTRQVPIVGVFTVNNFPFPVSIDSGDIGGPSAGLMWTLGLVDLLTPGDLTGGKVVAGTGTIELDGGIGPIGGISEKVVAAERAGAVVFFAPAEEASEAGAVAGPDIQIVPVHTYLDAILWLEQHGGSA